MSTVDYGDFTVTTTTTANGKTQQVQFKPGTPGANQQLLQQRVQQALATNATFLGLAAPTNAQTLAQVQALTREVNGLIRLLFSSFDVITDS